MHEVNGNSPGTLGHSDRLKAAIGSKIALLTKQFLSHYKWAIAHGTEAEGSNVVPDVLALALGISKLLGEAKVTNLQVALILSGDSSSVDALVVGHLHTIGSVPTNFVYVTNDVNVIYGGLRCLAGGQFQPTILATTQHNGDVVITRLYLEGTNCAEAAHVHKLVKNSDSAILGSANAITISRPAITI